VLRYLTMPSLSQLSHPSSRRLAALVLFIVSAGFALATLDLFVANLALPKIAQDFGSAGLGDLSWVLKRLRDRLRGPTCRVRTPG